MPIDSSSTTHDDESDELRFEVVNHVGLITLNRPQALNALTHNMVLRMSALLDQCEQDAGVHGIALRGTGRKAFCAGGDVLALYESARTGTALQRDFFIDEYRLVHRLHRYPKPVAALLHGVVMGGGMGLAQGARLRLATRHSRIAMPECRIGLVPDVGATHFFGRMPAPLALYLALSGISIQAADAIFVGLADEHARVDDPDELPALLKQIDWSGRRRDDQGSMLAAMHRALARDDGDPLAGATLPPLCSAIYAHFNAAHSVARIAEALAHTANDPAAASTDWARTTLEALQTRSPLMLALCRESLLRGRHMSLAACLRMEFDLVRHAIQCGEFTEGVRALLIDKDQSPRWAPASVNDLSDEQVRACMGPDASGEDKPATDRATDGAAERAPHPLADLGLV